MADGHWGTCIRCSSRMWMPPALYEAALAQAGKITFYCAYGHGQVFRSKEQLREDDEIRRERDRLKQQTARLEQELGDARLKRIQAEGWLKAEKAKAARIAKRIHAGVCPHCNRTFTNMARHMKTKHRDDAEVARLMGLGGTG